MRVAVYVEDDYESTENYNLSPDKAVEEYSLELDHEDGDANIIVVPIDDEAMVLPGWHSDADGTNFMMFVALPEVTVRWTVQQVDTLNPARASDAPKTGD